MFVQDWVDTEIESLNKKKFSYELQIKKGIFLTFFFLLLALFYLFSGSSLFSSDKNIDQMVYTYAAAVLVTGCITLVGLSIKSKTGALFGIAFIFVAIIASNSISSPYKLLFNVISVFVVFYYIRVYSFLMKYFYTNKNIIAISQGESIDSTPEPHFSEEALDNALESSKEDIFSITINDIKKDKNANASESENTNGSHDKGSHVEDDRESLTDPSQSTTSQDEKGIVALGSESVSILSDESMKVVGDPATSGVSLNPPVYLNEKDLDTIETKSTPSTSDKIFPVKNNPLTIADFTESNVDKGGENTVALQAESTPYIESVNIKPEGISQTSPIDAGLSESVALDDNKEVPLAVSSDSQSLSVISDSSDKNTVNETPIEQEEEIKPKDRKQTHNYFKGFNMLNTRSHYGPALMALDHQIEKTLLEKDDSISHDSIEVNRSVNDRWDLLNSLDKSELKRYFWDFEINSFPKILIYIGGLSCYICSAISAFNFISLNTLEYLICSILFFLCGTGVVFWQNRVSALLAFLIFLSVMVYQMIPYVINTPQLLVYISGVGLMTGLMGTSLYQYLYKEFIKEINGH